MTTKGEYRVGVDFTPSADSVVDQIKRAAADLIDLIEGIDATDHGEKARLKATAQTAIEDGAMWAVKAATKPDMPAGYSAPAGAPDPQEDLFMRVVREAVASAPDGLHRTKPLYEYVTMALFKAGFRDVTEMEVSNAIIEARAKGKA